MFGSSKERKFRSVRVTYAGVTDVVLFRTAEEYCCEPEWRDGRVQLCVTSHNSYRRIPLDGMSPEDVKAMRNAYADAVTEHNATVK